MYNPTEDFENQSNASTNDFDNTKIVMRFVHGADSIAELAKRIYVNREIAFDDHRFRQPYAWYKGVDATSTEFAQYVASESNTEKVAVLFECIVSCMVPMDFEKASIECWKAKNLKSFACLNRYGIVPPTDDLMAIRQDLDFLMVHCRLDFALQAKTNVPAIDLQRRVHPLAIPQAAFFLGYTDCFSNGGELGPAFYKLLDESIAKNNLKAFKYLLISNVELDENAISFKLIENRNVAFIKEMCRQGYKFDSKNRDGQTAIEYAVGKIADADFGIFFFKAGRFDFNNLNDRAIMQSVIRMMQNPAVVQAEMMDKSKTDILDPGYQMPDVDYPRVSNQISRMFNIDRLPKSVADGLTPVIVDNSDEPDFDLPKGYDYSLNYKNKYYLITDQPLVYKKRIEAEDEFGDAVTDYVDVVASDLLYGVLQSYKDIAPLSSDREFSEFSVHAVVTFINKVAEKQLYDCSNGVPHWIDNLLSKANISDLLDMSMISDMLGATNMHQALLIYMNKIVRNLSVEDVRALLAQNNATKVKFDELSFTFEITPRTKDGIQDIGFVRNNQVCEF